MSKCDVCINKKYCVNHRLISKTPEELAEWLDNNDYDYYGPVIQDLRYYAADKRRPEFYREQLAKAASTLEAATLELKECKALLKKIREAQETYDYVMSEIKRRMEAEE